MKSWLVETLSDYIARFNDKPTSPSEVVDVMALNPATLHDTPLAKVFNLVLRASIPSPAFLNRIFEINSLQERIVELLGFLKFADQRAVVEDSLHRSVQENIAKSQRAYFISELIRAAKTELNGDDGESDVDSLYRRLAEAEMPAEVQEKVRVEIQRYESMPQSAAEANTQRNYIDWMLNTPWKGDKLPPIDLVKAREILDEDHYGLDDVKERILEYLAVLSRVPKTKAPVLCLVGPPGIGKTSLASSIAKAVGRKYVRVALGGLHDEAEIRGHRRTYVAAMPGRIIQNLAKVKTNNPLFLLDEIDKLGQGHRGDPSSALLEVLDPNQNHTFADNFLEVEYDLSNILFIATANSYEISPALLDRMEVIELGSYSRVEKFEIAKRHILPKLLERNAVKPEEVEFSDEMVQFVIDGYTAEAGVRNLERLLENIIRHVIKEVAEGKTNHVVVDVAYIEKVLGPVINEVETRIREGSQVGVINGLAYTAAGGDPLTIEVATPKGNGKIQHTGSLGDNIKESVQAAITVLRQRYEDLGLPEDFYSKQDYHIHFPNAAVKKDGPSAGAAITTALYSSLSGKPIDKDIGMTGEISLMGRVMIIGGVKEKVISAHRSGIRHIILPKANMPHLYKVPQSIQDDLQFYPVETIDEVFDIVFGDKKRPTKVNIEKNVLELAEKDADSVEAKAKAQVEEATNSSKAKSTKAKSATSTKAKSTKAAKVEVAKVEEANENTAEEIAEVIASELPKTKAKKTTAKSTKAKKATVVEEAEVDALVVEEVEEKATKAKSTAKTSKAKTATKAKSSSKATTKKAAVDSVEVAKVTGVKSKAKAKKAVTVELEVEAEESQPAEKPAKKTTTKKKSK